MLLHSDISGYNLPAINFMSLSEEVQENHILEEEYNKIHKHLEKVLMHMIDKQVAQIFKSHDDYVWNKRKFLQYLKYAETWQSMSVICLHAAFLCDILLKVMFITFFLKYHKTIQAMLAAFITTNMSGIYVQLKLTQHVEHSPPLYSKPPRRRSNCWGLRGHRRNANYHTSYIIYCMCYHSYYNIISDLQEVPLYAFNYKILCPIFSDFENFKEYS